MKSTGKIQAFFDSGAAFIPDPGTSNMLKDYFSNEYKIPVAKGDIGPCEMINRSMLPTINIEMAGIDLSVTPDMYWQELPRGSGETKAQCEWNLGFDVGAKTSAQLGGMMVIGEMIFGSYVAVFDWDHTQVCLATKVGTNLRPFPDSSGEHAFLDAA